MIYGIAPCGLFDNTQSAIFLFWFAFSSSIYVDIIRFVRLSQPSYLDLRSTFCLDCYQLCYRVGRHSVDSSDGVFLSKKFWKLDDPHLTDKTNNSSVRKYSEESLAKLYNDPHVTVYCGLWTVDCGRHQKQSLKGMLN